MRLAPTLSTITLLTALIVTVLSIGDAVLASPHTDGMYDDAQSDSQLGTGTDLYAKGGKKPKNPTATPAPTAVPSPPPQPCVGCPEMFVRSIVVGANKNPNGSTYATCRVVIWDENGNTLEGINVLHEWSGSASGTEVDVTAPQPPYATSTWITVDNGPKCKGRNASRTYTCTVLDVWSDDYTYVPANNWEDSDSDEACTP